MPLKIVKKKLKSKKVESNTAVITILGMINANEAEYTSSLNIETGYFKNMLPLLINNYSNLDKVTIIPIYTDEALLKQKNVISNTNFDIEKNGRRIDEENFTEFFNIINEILSNENYNNLIIDISHGFRHLPILSTISMLISNFQDSSKIKNILFAKEIIPKMKYEIIDLKEYLEIANISFVLTTFNDNYTVANHINSKKYNKLLNALNEFSNDIMALNLSNLQEDTLPTLCKELDKVVDISIETMARQLKINIIKDFKLEKKMYLTFYKISKNLHEKNYILPSLSMLYESIRIYVKTGIKYEEKAIVLKIEKYFENDLYKIGDFFKNLNKKTYDRLKKTEQKLITSYEYNKLVDSFNRVMVTPSLMSEISNTRNDLSHANSKEKFDEIKEKAADLIHRYNNNYDLDNKL